MSLDSVYSDMASPQTLLLVDGSSYLYRAFHAMPDLRGPEGEPTGAVHGIVAMLQFLRQQVPASLAACVFDAPGPTFRDAWYPQYKAHRAPMPDALRAQIEPIHEVVKLLGWPVLEVPGIEADDAIGTLARNAAAQGMKVVISTGDKDLAQLVSPEITLINTMSRETLDAPSVLAKFGVPPERIVDYLTLMGDAVDNVPGVDKVGPKTAAKWIAEYGSLEGVLAAADRIKGVAGENLRRARDWLPTARRLVSIRTDCDLGGHIANWPQLENLRLLPGNREELISFYTRHGFKTWKRELESSVSPMPQPQEAVKAADSPNPTNDDAAKVSSGDYETVTSWERLDHWLDRLRGAPLAALDTETDALDPMRARIVGISFAVEPGQAAYVPLAHDYPGAPTQLPLDEVLGRMRPWLEDPQAPKVGQNIKYDLHVFANHGIDVKGYAHDTLLESYVLEAHRPHNLGSLALRHLGRRGIEYEELCGKGASQIPFGHVDVARAAVYSGEDSDMTLQLHEQIFLPQLRQSPRQLELYEKIELPTASLLARVERHGVLIDAAALALQSQQLAQRMLQLEREAYDIAGQPFNLGSPKQIGDILFTKLGLPIRKKTATGAPSTDEEVLQDLAVDYPLPARILEHRGLSKLRSTYTEKLPSMVNPRTGRLHTNYAQAVTITGRLSSNEPNLQNIPIRTAEGRRVREAFIAPPGHRIVSADYSQIELRLMAHISGDENLRQAFLAGHDVHRSTAAEVFDVPLDQVSSEQRRYAKTINFGLIYGMGAFGLARSLGIDQKAARDYIERYFARYPGVKHFMETVKSDAAQAGYVETLFGRRIHLPEIRGGSGPRRSAAERQAINAPMQGSAADLIKLAMIAVQRHLDAERLEASIIMQVHDELVLEVPDHEVARIRMDLPRLMSSVAELSVPLIAEVGDGKNWEEAH